jgi:hypothetical protein
MKYSKNFERDYKLYLRLADKFNFSACDIKQKYNKVKYSENGVTAKGCFFFIDSNGKYIDCKETDLLFKILNCKASINFHIKLWAEEIYELICENNLLNWKLAIGIISEIQNEYNFPDWVITAICIQAKNKKLANMFMEKK